MTKFRENPDAWTQVDAILEYSGSQYTKFFALQILEALIKTRWRALPREQCEGSRSRVDSIMIHLYWEVEQDGREEVNREEKCTVSYRALAHIVIHVAVPGTISS